MNHIKVRMCVRKCPHGLPWVGCISKSKNARNLRCHCSFKFLVQK